MRRAVTLIELMIILATLALAMGIAIPHLIESKHRREVEDAPAPIPPSWTVSDDVFQGRPILGRIITQTATGRQWLLISDHAIVEITQPMEKK